MITAAEIGALVTADISGFEKGMRDAYAGLSASIVAYVLRHNIQLGVSAYPSRVQGPQVEVTGRSVIVDEGTLSF